MHKVLIVDDDWLILEDICSLIRWESCGFHTPMAAQSAKEAMEILEKTPAELVITDISMPEISGVELIRQAKQLYPDTVFAVLSNYDDFLYVRDAMKAGAVEYLLKYEIEPDNLIPFLKQMAGEIRAKNRQYRNADSCFRCVWMRSMTCAVYSGSRYTGTNWNTGRCMTRRSVWIFL